MGVQHYAQPMFVSSTNRTTCLQYTLRGATFSAAYVCNLYPSELLGYTTLMGV